MHGHVSKRVKMHIKSTGGTNKHGKHIITRNGKGKGAHEVTRHLKMPPRCLNPNMASKASDATTYPLRVSNAAKLRIREANTSMKNRSK